MGDESNGFVVLDTNIWVHTTRLLRTGLGAALLHSVKQTKKVLGLPEVIELEIRKHVVKSGTAAIDLIDANYRLIEQLMGARDDYQVPSAEAIAQRVDSRLNDLSALLHRVPFSLQHAKNALARVMDESPPNGLKNQQFKDSAIWEAILELSLQGPVSFVTADRAFFKDQKTELGLAPNLVADCDAAKVDVRIFSEVGGYLHSIKQEVPTLDKERVVAAVNTALMSQLLQMADVGGYELGQLTKQNIDAYLTETVDVIAVEFELSYEARGVLIPNTQIEVRGTNVVHGSCTYQLQDGSVSDLHLGFMKMFDDSGQQIPTYGSIYAYASSHSGRMTIPYTVRYPLD